jgi:hypothetical protein
LTPLEQIARTALSGDALATRSLLQDWLVTNPSFADAPPPSTGDEIETALSAALIELFSLRCGQTPPAWAATIGPSPRPVHLLRSAKTMRRLREICEAESPLPLRRRHFYAPSNYLEAV